MNLSLTIADGTHDELQSRIEAWLDAHVEMYERQARPTHRWNSSEQLVRVSGRWMEGNIWDMTCADLAPGQCFQNAFIMSQVNTGWSYWEGWALMPYSIPTHHAWCVDTEGRVQDPTWKPLYRQYRDNDAARGSPQRYGGDVVYLGVSPDPMDHLHWTLSRGQPNLLSLGEMDIDDVIRDGVSLALRSNSRRIGLAPYR